MKIPGFCLPKIWRVSKSAAQVTSKAQQLQEQAAEVLSSAKEKDQMLGSGGGKVAALGGSAWALPVLPGVPVRRVRQGRSDGNDSCHAMCDVHGEGYSYSPSFEGHV